jgi:hypothetical protein
MGPLRKPNPTPSWRLRAAHQMKHRWCWPTRHGTRCLSSGAIGQVVQESSGAPHAPAFPDAGASDASARVCVRDSAGVHGRGRPQDVPQLREHRWSIRRLRIRMAGLRVASSVSLSSSHPVPAALHRRTVHRAPVRRTTTPVMKIDYVPAAEVRHAHVPRSSKRRERNGSAPHDHPVHLAARPGRLAQINIAGEAVARATLRSIDARR